MDGLVEELMPKYRRKPQRQRSPSPDAALSPMVIGMLYIADVRLVLRDTGETVKHKVLMVGCEAQDIERKLRWVFDSTSFSEMSLSGVEKVKEKVHIISTTTTQPASPGAAVIKRPDGSKVIPYPAQRVERYDPKCFAVGVTTTMLAKDENHAIRKVGYALINADSGLSHGGARLSDDSTVVVEQIPLSSGFAMPRDVSNEINEATFVRG